MSSAKIISFNKSSNSGAKLSLDECGCRPVVRKTILSFNARDIKSVNKQRKFINTNEIVAVPIISCNTNKDTIDIKMPYIAGLVSNDYSIFADKNTKGQLTKSFNTYFQVLEKDAIETKLPVQKIVEKSEMVLQSIRTNYILTDKALSLSEHLTNENIKKVSNGTLLYPKSQCHGDLTLSNIIFSESEKKFYLIDFLEVYLDSYIIDYVKLLQDLIYGWSSRYENKPTQLRFSVFGSQVIEDFYKPDIKYTKTLEVLNVLNILRIGPYINDLQTGRWFESTLESL